MAKRICLGCVCGWVLGLLIVAGLLMYGPDMDRLLTNIS